MAITKTEERPADPARTPQPIIPPDHRWQLSPVRRRRLGLLAAGLIIVVYLAGWCPIWLPGNDSAIYRVLGHNLATGQGYTAFGKPHITVPPGFPLMLAGMEKLGLSDGAMNAVMIGLGLLAVWLAWLLLRQQTTFEWALPAVLLFALSDHVQSLSMQMLSDVPCLLLVLLGLWLYVRWSAGKSAPVELGSLALVAAVWIRLAMLPLVFGAALGLVLQRKKPSALRAWSNAALVGVCTSLTLGIFYLYYRHNFDPTAPTYAHHVAGLGGRGIAEWLAVPLGNLAVAAQSAGRLFTGQGIKPAAVAAVIFLPIVLVGMVHCLRRNQVVGVVTTIAYIGGLVLLRDVIARYLAPLAVLLVLYFADGLAVLLDFLSRLKRQKSENAASRLALWPSQAAVAVLLALTATNLVYDAKTIYSVHHGDILANYDDGQKLPNMQAAHWLRDNTPADELFFATASTWQLAYLSDRPALPLARKIMENPPPARDIFDLLDYQCVRHFVLEVQPGAKNPWRPIVQSGLEQGKLRQVWANAKFEVYEYRTICASSPAVQHSPDLVGKNIQLTWMEFDGKDKSDPQKAIYVLNGQSMGTGDAGFERVLEELTRLPRGGEMLIFPDASVLNVYASSSSAVEPIERSDHVPFWRSESLIEKLRKTVGSRNIKVFFLYGRPGEYVSEKSGEDMREAWN